MHVHRSIVGIVIVALAALLFFVVLGDNSLSSTSVGQGPGENPAAFYSLGPAILGFAGLILIKTAVVRDYRSNWNRGER